MKHFWLGITVLLFMAWVSTKFTNGVGRPLLLGYHQGGMEDVSRGTQLSCIQFSDEYEAGGIYRGKHNKINHSENGPCVGERC